MPAVKLLERHAVVGPDNLVCVRVDFNHPRRGRIPIVKDLNMITDPGWVVLTMTSAELPANFSCSCINYGYTIAIAG